MKKVLIIGNGFDLHHNLPTKWMDFKKFLESEREESELKNSCKTLLIWINEIKIKEHKFWTDVEKHLGETFKTIVNEEEKLYFLKNLDLFSNLFEYYIEYVVHPLLKNINKYPKIDTLIRETDVIFSYNYSRVCEILYDTPMDKIIHIHGKCEYLEPFTQTPIDFDPNRKFNIIIGCDKYYETKVEYSHYDHRNTKEISKTGRLSNISMINKELRKSYDFFLEATENGITDPNRYLDYELTTFGFSFGPSDKLSIKFLQDIHPSDIKILINKDVYSLEKHEENLIFDILKISKEMDDLDNQVINTNTFINDF